MPRGERFSPHHHGRNRAQTGSGAVDRFNADQRSTHAAHSAGFSRCSVHSYHSRSTGCGAFARQAGVDASFAVGQEQESGGRGALLGMDRAEGPEVGREAGVALHGSPLRGPGAAAARSAGEDRDVSKAGSGLRTYSAGQHRFGEKTSDIVRGRFTEGQFSTGGAVERQISGGTVGGTGNADWRIHAGTRVFAIVRPGSGELSGKNVEADDLCQLLRGQAVGEDSYANVAADGGLFGDSDRQVRTFPAQVRL